MKTFGYIECARCGKKVAIGRGVRMRLLAEGWISEVVGFDEWWKCWECAPPPLGGNGRRGEKV